MLQYPTNEGMWDDRTVHLHCMFYNMLNGLGSPSINYKWQFSSEILSATWSLEFLGSTQGDQTSMLFKVNKVSGHFVMIILFVLDLYFFWRSFADTFLEKRSNKKRDQFLSMRTIEILP